MQNKEQLQKYYADLKIKEKVLKEEISKLGPQLLDMMEETEEETEFGKFSIKKLRKWTYPAEVEALEDQFKSAKEEAQQLGTATYEESESLVFNQVKN